MADKPQVEGIKAAMDTAKQIITLSTGVVALTVTFLEKIVQTKPDVARHVPCTLSAAWILYGFAVLFAVWTLMALTGTLTAIDRRSNGLALSEAQKPSSEAQRPTSEPEQPIFDADRANVRLPALGMVICFLIAMALTIGTGFFI